MRKLLALLFVASAFTFASCGKGGETTNADSTNAVSDSVAAPDPLPADTASTMSTDTTGAEAPADSAK